MTEQEFQVYKGYFNSGDFEKVTSYFADDVKFEYFDYFTKEPQAPSTVLNSKQDFMNKYLPMSGKIKEFIDLDFGFFEEKRMLVGLHAEWHCFEDGGKLKAGAMKKGEVFMAKQWVYYVFDDAGKYKHIRIAHHHLVEGQPRFHIELK
jgi:hypothetical protein